MSHSGRRFCACTPFMIFMVFMVTSCLRGADSRGRSEPAASPATVERSAPRRIVARPEPGGRLPPLETEDGLSLTILRTGAVARVSLDHRTCPSESVRSGLWIEPFQGPRIPVAGRLSVEEGAIVQQFRSRDLGLIVRARFSAHGGFIECSGTVEDVTGEDRALDVLLSVPVGDAEWRWGESLRESPLLKDGPYVMDTATFSAVAQAATGQGVALAVPADSPCDCDFTYDRQFGYAVRFRFGLSHAAAGRLEGRAPFRLVLYRCDGRWGLRDAARRYYEFYPDAFAKRVEREGLWMFGSPRFPIPDPENYAFHEGGPAGWEYDDAHKISTFPYIIPGQREITGLPDLPATVEEALTVFRAYAPPADPSAVRRPGASVESNVEAQFGRPSRGWGSSMKEIIENCMLLDADGHPHVRIRNTAWGGNSITFPLNANPALFSHEDRATVAKALLKYAGEVHEAIPQLDGVYVDSLGNWGSYLNHRREHFPFAQTPLSYDARTGKPGISNRFALLEFLGALRRQLHNRGKLLFANGLHPNRRFHFFAVDVLGVEGRGALEQKRLMACQKPFLLLIYNIHDDIQEMERQFHRCTFYGVYPSFANMKVYQTPEMYAPVAALNNRFTPALRAITAAGWRPVTAARSSIGDVWVERWGPGRQGAVYLTVYNSASRQLRSTLTIDLAEMKRTGAECLLTDILAGDAWRAAVQGGVASAKIAVPAGAVRVLRLESRSAAREE